MLQNGSSSLKTAIRSLEGIYPSFSEKKKPVKTYPPFKPVIPVQGIVLDEVEKQYILEALRVTKGNKLQAAKLLGISRSALLYRMQKYGIESNP